MNRYESMYNDMTKYIPKDISNGDRDKYLEVFSKIKEVDNTLFPVSGEYKAYIIQLTFMKNFKSIRVNGYICFGEENRIIDSYIYDKDGEFEVKTHITRLSYNDKNKEYDTIDNINKTQRKTKYSFNEREYVEDLERNVKKYEN